ncbi:MAG: alpha/beta fold hydrolase, partial [Thermoanaerobaculia bacterium]
MSSHDSETRARHQAGGRAPSERWLRRGLSALNGFVGDHLHARGNALAIEMAFQHRGRTLPLSPEALREAFPQATPRLCVLVHGLGCDEAVWHFPPGVEGGVDTTYASLLAAELGYTPFLLRYNTGLPIDVNGTGLARLLEALVAAYPTRVDELVLIGHSMGGVVVRYACHAAAAEGGSRWLPAVTRTIALGAPLDGADLARFAHLSSTLLRAPAHPVTGLIGDLIDVRSRGIKDLRLRWRDLTLPPRARHHEIFGALTRSRAHLATRLFGDGLVHGPGSGDDSGSGDTVKHFAGVR